ncbi:MAG: restriction endonuclease subunit S [Candidatus Hydrogenedens sp.]|nr:restriction endonuclease subunit S [Candidatus Hydrogenedens sp.]
MALTMNKATRVAFGDVVRLSTERSKDPMADGLDRYVGLEHLEPGELKIREWGDVADGTTFTSVFRPGQVLFGKRRAYQRKVAVADFSGVCSGDIYVFEPKNKRLLPELLPFLCQTDAFFDYAVGTSAGSLSPRTNWKNLADFEFALPPLDEQRRMVEVLQAARRAHEQLRVLELAISLAQAARLDLAFPRDKLELEKSPRLQSMCELVVDGTHFPPKFQKSGIPFLLVSNLEGGRIHWNTEKYVSEESFAELTKKWSPRRNDILYSLVGSFGVPALVESDTRFTFQRHIGLIRTRHEELLPQYLYWYLKSPAGVRQANWRAEGLAQKTITLGTLRDYSVPSPPIAQQRVLVHELETLEQLRCNARERAQAARALQTMAWYKTSDRDTP